MLDIKRYSSIRDQVLNDLPRRKKAWDALSELWVWYYGEDLHKIIFVPNGLSKDEINQYVAKWVANKLLELDYSLQEVKHIYYWEAQPFLNQSHIIQPLSPLPFNGMDLKPLEKMFQSKKFCPFYFLFCGLTHLLFGWINPTRSRWKRVQIYMRDSE